MERIQGIPVTSHPCQLLVLQMVLSLTVLTWDLTVVFFFFFSLGGQVTLMPELQELYSTMCVYVCVVYMCVQVHMPIWKPEDISVFCYHPLS